MVLFYLIDDLESQISIFIMDNFPREDVRKIIIKIIQSWHGHAGGSLEMPVQNVAENNEHVYDVTMDEHGQENDKR